MYRLPSAWEDGMNISTNQPQRQKYKYLVLVPHLLGWVGRPIRRAAISRVNGHVNVKVTRGATLWRLS
jgi:hypothetical protein